MTILVTFFNQKLEFHSRINQLRFRKLSEFNRGENNYCSFYFFLSIFGAEFSSRLERWEFLVER